MSRNTYTEDNIRSLDWREHIRLRPGMYIGKLGDGSSADDGIYILLKEIIDNSIDEFVMGAGKTIEIALERKTYECSRLRPRNTSRVRWLMWCLR
jgi:topoisomerase-4 subunit B